MGKDDPVKEKKSSDKKSTSNAENVSESDGEASFLAPAYNALSYLNPMSYSIFGGGSSKNEEESSLVSEESVHVSKAQNQPIKSKNADTEESETEESETEEKSSKKAVKNRKRRKRKKAQKKAEKQALEAPVAKAPAKASSPPKDQEESEEDREEREARKAEALRLDFEGFGGKVIKKKEKNAPLWRRVVDSIKIGEEMPNRLEWGKYFGNFQGILPQEDGLTYLKYDVDAAFDSKKRGTRRIVVGSNGKYYYTPDEYKTFKEVT